MTEEVGRLSTAVAACEARIDDFLARAALASWHGVPYPAAGFTESQERVREPFRLLEPQAATGHQKARFGSANDGGYVMIDDFRDIAAAVSLGIEGNVDWDIDIAGRGVPVYQFDHSIDAAPVVREDLVFTKARVGTEPGALTLDDLVERIQPPGSRSLILKADIEGAEWEIFDAVSDAALASFAQIICEFHGLDRSFHPLWRERSRRVWQKLYRHFAAVHVHANNNGPVAAVANVPLPVVVEITFASRLRYDFKPSRELFPSPLDAPNDPLRPDIWLGSFLF